MADFVAVLRKTIDGLSDNTPAMREKVYRKARETIAAKLAAIDPPPSRIVIDRQHKALEDAINAVEASYTESAPDDFESVLAGLEPKREPATGPAPVFSDVRPVEPAGSGLAPISPQPPSPETAPLDAPHGGDPVADEALTPIAPVRRPEPPLAGERKLAGDNTQDSVAPVRPQKAGRKRGVSSGLVAAVIALLVVGAAGYGIWLNRGVLEEMLGTGSDVVAEQPASPPAPEAEQPEEEVAAAPAAQPAEEEPAKFTQRLLADGQEVDDGPAGGENSVGEGTSMAAATQASEPAPAGQPAPTTEAGEQPAPAQPAASGDQAVPVGQRAIFYEERTNVAQGSADNGSAVWSLVQESPGGNLPPEPAIRAEVSIPGKDIQFRMTIRRNGDKTLPASHIIEMIFLTSGTFEGGGIDSVLRVAMKSSEAAPGTPLMGIPAKIADGYFLVALSDAQADEGMNTQLLARQSWFDIPIVYRSGRRALVTMEKGVPGERIFQEALQAWRNASSG